MRIAGIQMNPKFTLIGLIIGFLIGLTGVGGGSLMTPVMILVMGVKPIIAVGTDLAYGAITKIVGAGAHLRQGTVHRRTAYLLASGSVPATLLGVGLTDHIRTTTPAFVSVFLLRAIAWTLIVVAAVLVLGPLLQRYGRERRDVRDVAEMWGEKHPWILPIAGAVVGFLVGLTSVGSGSLIIVGLFFLYPRWQSKDLVGTDVFHAAILVSAASLAQFASGNVNVGMMASLLLGSMPGVLIGSRLSIGFPERLLRFSLAGLLFASGVRLL